MRWTIQKKGIACEGMRVGEWSVRGVTHNKVTIRVEGDVEAAVVATNEIGSCSALYTSSFSALRAGSCSSWCFRVRWRHGGGGRHDESAKFAPNIDNNIDINIAPNSTFGNG